MRRAALDNSFKLHNQLVSLIEKKDAWQNDFAALWRMDISFVRRYNDVVLGWIVSWKNRLHDKLTAESIFAAENVDSHVLDSISRARSELKTLLHLRQQLFQIGLYDVTTAPYLPANQAYLFAVESVLPEAESACTWLMPWVKRVTGGATPTDIKLATEDPITGRFEASRFVMGVDGESLISIEDSIGYATRDVVSADSFFSNKPLHSTFRKMLGVSALNYIRALHYRYNEQHSDASVFGYHVIRFAAALNEYSVNRGAEEFRAKEEYEEAVIEFYRVWHALSEPLQKQLGDTKIATSIFSFKDYIDTLLITVPEIDLPEEEKAAIEKKEILKCSAVMSSILFSFMTEHPEWHAVTVVESDVARKSLYTDADFESIKKDFEDSFSGKTRVLGCSDVFAMAIQPGELLHCDQFFKLASLIPLLPEDFLTRLTAKHPSQFCGNAEEVMHFLSSIEDRSMRAQYFTVFAEYWGKYFKGRERFIILCAFFEVSELACVVNFFFDQMKLYFSDEFGNDASSWMKKQCKNFSFSLQTVFQHFVMGVLKHAPMLVENSRGLLKCLQVFDSAKSYDLVLDLAPHCVKLLSVDFASFTRLLVFLDEIPKKEIAGEYSAALLCSVLFPRVLPLLFSDEKVEAVWERTKSTCCCSGFFYSARVDKKAYGDLVEVTTLEVKGALTSYEASVLRVRILDRLITENCGGTFLTGVNEYYANRLVSLVQQKMSMMACSMPVSVAGY